MQQMQTDMRNQRLRLGFTLPQLADECARAGVPVDHSQLSKIERGHHSPRPGLRAVLARLLGLDALTFEVKKTAAQSEGQE